MKLWGGVFDSYKAMPLLLVNKEFAAKSIPLMYEDLDICGVDQLLKVCRQGLAPISRFTKAFP